MRLFPRLCAALAAAAAVSLAGGPAAADQAVVVGINKYPHLPPEAALRGCETDAGAIAERLRALGFEVDLVTGARAGKESILQALAHAGQKNQPDERFVVFFAGHGSKLADGSVVLLPSDTRPDASHVLTSEELHRAVEAVPASARTVLLDACFSGFFDRGSKWKKRHYDFQWGSPGPRAVSNQEGTDFLSRGPSSVFYLTASRRTEEALEGSLGGGYRGVFSYYLEKQLQASPPTWGGVLATVGSQVPELTGDRQHPTYKSGYEQVPLFGARSETAAPSEAPASGPDLTLWEQYNLDAVDPARLQLTLTPDRTPLPVGVKVQFQVRVEQDGYLVLIEHGTSGRINLMYPLSASVGDARVARGTVVTMPSDGGTYSADEPGMERLKAILFTSDADAVKLLSRFTGSRSLTFEAFSRDMQHHPAEGGAVFTTSDLMFEVVP